MWLALDIGNSSVKGGLFEGSGLVHTFRLDLTRRDPPEAWDAALRAALAGQRVERAGVASVVPPVVEGVRAVLSRLTGAAPVVVHPGLRLPLRLAYETPHTLGADRLAAAVAAWTRYGHAPETPRDVVALDAGTAVTYDVVDRTGTFLGGPIGAGPVLVRQGLATGTAQLPEVPLERPVEVIGRSTREALQSGILYGFIDSVAGMLARLAARLGRRPYVVATGGWAPFLADHLDAIDHVEPHLVLQGIYDLMVLNGGSA
ncbi:type III pantothenate kinase [Rhodocaloribacter litoris]|uniref:type III pantothenate kinase n=1 Tax=Rhodocaloribacter litoris TaxID=2558931 RepID=UPI00141FEA8A|nr:type III pantothenate kinase [Rhodocaloribacter litoris]QXD14303.1 type III pantothenate kinase [Rhodocaloribacter litoris]